MLYFGHHFFIKADEGGLLLVYVTEIEHHGRSQPFEVVARKTDMVANFTGRIVEWDKGRGHGWVETDGILALA